MKRKKFAKIAEAQKWKDGALFMADEDDDVKSMLPPLLTGMLEEQLMSSCLTVTFLFIEDSLV